MLKFAFTRFVIYNQHRLVLSSVRFIQQRILVLHCSDLLQQVNFYLYRYRSSAKVKHSSRVYVHVLRSVFVSLRLQQSIYFDYSKNVKAKVIGYCCRHVYLRLQ
jgi:hypothetical protein